MAHDMSKGMHWIGYPGALHPIIDRGDIAVTDDIEADVSVAMSGARRVRLSPSTDPRTWRLSIPASHADELQALRTLQAARVGGMQLVTAEAQVSNVLTPERSTLQSVLLPGSGVALSGGWPTEEGHRTAITAAMPGGGMVRIGPAPTPPTWTGRRISLSCQLAGTGAYIILDWLNAAGTVVGSINGSSVTTSTVLRRSSIVAALPPAGTVSCRLATINATVIAQPQVTWTDALIPEWSLGNGADRVVVSALSRATDLQVPDSRSLRRADYAVELMEVSQ